ncbi:MAG: 1-deoxy-D-xylulose-5-phosphate reductoisomerase [Chlamydiales bacterium]|nr:1-deoxy-D-xylulose-5-phosphate reductoisomerase [Chlamydiales bacterium]
MKKIALLGSTGSIGKSTLEVARHLKLDVVALGCHSNLELLEKQIQEFQPKVVAVHDRKAAAELRKRVAIEVLEGEEGMCQLAALPEVEFVLMAILGLAALGPTLCALDAKKALGLANKEVIVSAGELVMSRVDSPLIPVDSEHSALFQCLQKMEEPKRLILTASGGPFRNHPKERLASVTREEALAHPTWQMGAKITVDCSTLMNKGFEVIEARWLFDMPMEKIEVVVHPQSIIHSFVEGPDGIVFAQMHEPSMTIPIQYAITYPQRVAGMAPPFDFFAHKQLDFLPPDMERFRCLALAFEAGRQGLSSPCYLNAANEELVKRFLRQEIEWSAIAHKLEKLMERHQASRMHDIETVFAVDQQARREAQEL